MQALLQQAGTHSGAGQVDPLCWENFRAWFSKGLKTLHQVSRQCAVPHQKHLQQTEPLETFLPSLHRVGLAQAFEKFK